DDVAVKSRRQQRGDAVGSARHHRGRDQLALAFRKRRRAAQERFMKLDQRYARPGKYFEQVEEARTFWQRWSKRHVMFSLHLVEAGEDKGADADERGTHQWLGNP